MFILVIGIILKRFLFEELCRYLLLQLCVCHSFLSFGKVETLTVNKEKWKFLGNFSCFCSACTGSVQVALLLERLQVVGWWCRWWGRQNWHSWEAISLVPTRSNLTHLSFGVSLLHFWIMMKWVLVCCKWESFFWKLWWGYIMLLILRICCEVLLWHGSYGTRLLLPFQKFFFVLYFLMKEAVISFYLELKVGKSEREKDETKLVVI